MFGPLAYWSVREMPGMSTTGGSEPAKEESDVSLGRELGTLMYVLVFLVLVEIQNECLTCYYNNTNHDFVACWFGLSCAIHL
jgi:hypothetical protein